MIGGEENTSRNEGLQELRVTSTDVRGFSDSLFETTLSVSKGKTLTELFPDITQRKLAEGIIPSFQDAIKKTYDKSEKFIPNEPLHKVIWALTGIRFSGAALALDRYTGYSDEIRRLHPLIGEGSIEISLKDLTDVGRILGNLLSNHALADRPLSELKPELGDLGNERSGLLTISRDRLRLLDTILDQLKTKPANKEKIATVISQHESPPPLRSQGDLNPQPSRRGGTL